MKEILIKLFEPKSNHVEAAVIVTSLLGVKISETTLKREIEEHPDYPSLLSISDVFTHYGIDNIGVKYDPAKVNEIPCPFIVQIKSTRSTIDNFAVVKDIDNQDVTFFDPEIKKWIATPKDVFLGRCTGIALVVEASDTAGERNYDQLLSKEKRKRSFQFFILSFIPAITLLIGILALYSNGISALLPFIFASLTLIGVAIGILLLWYEIDQDNHMLTQICTSGKNTSCGAVLQSKAAKIAGISWSAIGFSYFMGLTLLLIWGGITDAGNLFIIAWVNLAAVSYVPFSIYYQWRVAKRWCVLCLTVQALLVLQLIIVVLGHWHSISVFNSIIIELCIKVIVVFAIPFLGTLAISSVLKKAKESTSLNTALKRLKHNPEIFNILLLKQKKVTFSTDKLGIIIGDPAAPHTLIKVCAPYCNPCSKAHPQIEDLIENNPNVKLQIIFNAYGNGYDKSAIPVKHLLAIYEQENQAKIKHALDDWYLPETKDYEKFAAKYQVSGELDSQLSKINAMREWCDKMEVDETPTFFFNGYQLPDIYRPNDLKYFLSS